MIAQFVISQLTLNSFQYFIVIHPSILNKTLLSTFFTGDNQPVIILFGLLGMAMIAFFLINLRSNLKRKRGGIPSKSIRKGRLPEDNEPLEEWNILNAHPTPTAIIKRDGVLLHINPAFANVFGTSPENMSQLLLFNILPAHVSTDLSISISRQYESSGTTTNSFFSPNTKSRYVASWHRGEKKDTIKNEILIILEKVAEQPKKENSSTPLEESQKLIKQVFDLSQAGIIIEDYNGTIIEANEAACNIYGLQHQELVGKELAGLSSADFRKAIATSPQILSGQGTSFRSISYLQGTSPLPVEVKVSKITYFGKQALVFVVNDLTEKIENRKTLDELKLKAQESDRLKSSFLSNLSHEVRTPMNSIMGFAELLAEPGFDKSEREEFIRLIRQSGKELLSQINNMIDFSKLEAGLINLNIKVCDFDILFNQLHNFAFERMIPGQELKLFFDLPSSIMKNGIATDVDRLKQILTIFIDNSIKFTKSGFIEVGIKLKAPQIYEFFVRDTGIGIPEDKHQQIFENFRQVDNSNSREFAGMGLGLSIASRLIQLLDGHQWIVSEPGKGSEIRCVLPDLLYPHESPSRQVSGGPSTMVKKIMVIAPTEDIYLELSNKSKPVNYQVFWAQNAQETRAMLLSNHIRYVLIAVDMLPFWQELLPKIRSIQKKIQIIGISKNLDPSRKTRLISMGLNDVVGTSITIPVLLSILEYNMTVSGNLLESGFN